MDLGSCLRTNKNQNTDSTISWVGLEAREDKQRKIHYALNYVFCGRFVRVCESGQKFEVCFSAGLSILEMMVLQSYAL